MGVEAKNRKVLAMADSIIMERVADAATGVFLRGTRQNGGPPGPSEALVAAAMRKIAAGVLRRCIERFDAELVGNMPRGWSVHERAVRTLVTLVGGIAFVGPSSATSSGADGPSRTSCWAYRRAPGSRPGGRKSNLSVLQDVRPLEHARLFGVAALCVFAKMDCCCIWLTS